MSKSETTNNVLLRSQTENTLVNNVFHLLNSNESVITSDIDNLIKYINAIVMFDIVDLPTAAKKELAEENIPDVIQKAEIFNAYLIEDYETNLKEAEIRVENALNSWQRKSSRDLPEIGSDSSDLDKQYTRYIDDLHKKLDFDPNAFWNNCKIKSKPILNDWDNRKFRVIKSAFARPRYEELDFHKQLGIYHLWRAYNNVEIVTRNNTVFINNQDRTPFVADAYESAGNQFLNNFFSGNEVNLESLPKRKFELNLNKDYLIKRAVPLLLHKVLVKAKCERKRVADAILDVRHSKSAERFRAKYRQILERDYGRDNPRRVTNEISKDFNSLLSILQSLDDKRLQPLIAILPFSQVIAAVMIAYEYCDIKSLKEILVLGSLAALSKPLMKYYDLRHLWFFSPVLFGSYDKELGDLLKKTFGEIG